MKQNAASWLLYFFAVGMAGAVMMARGMGVCDWEYWAIQACMIMAHVAGGTQEI